MSLSRKIAEPGTWVLFGLALSASMVFLFVAFLPYSAIKTGLDTLAADHSASVFNEAWFNQITARLKGAGILCAGFAAVVFIARSRIRLYLSDLAIAAVGAFNTARVYLKRMDWREDKAAAAALLIIICTGIALRLVFINQPMRFDEAGTFLNSATRPALIALSYYATPNNHLFHTLLVRISCLIFGEAAWVIRLPAFICGTVLIPTVYAVARRLGHKYAALLAAALTAVSSPLIEFSTNARGYSIVVFIFFCLLLLGFYLKRGVNAAAWFMFSGLAALAVYTIPAALYPVGVVTGWLAFEILSNKDSRRLLRLKGLITAAALAGAFTIVLYLPVLIVSGWQALAGNEFVTARDWLYLKANFPGLLASVWDQWNRDIPAALRLIIAAGFIYAVFITRRGRVLVLTAAAVAAAVVLVQRVLPPARVWLFLLPLYLSVASSGFSGAFTAPRFKNLVFSRFLYPGLVAGIAVILCVFVLHSGTIVYSNETGTMRDAAAIASDLAEVLREGDRVLALVPSDAVLEYYLRIQGLPESCLWMPFDHCRRIYVVVNEAYSQTLYELLAESELNSFEYSAPRLWREYESATIYKLKKR